ncbi:glycosyltransferase [Sphingomonas ginkgonis]|uniref:Glycosyltransferase n=1 Tax=Sphingomonas ginkgonis TaxID=2315330 RepID=A0A429V8Q3_9SPHN|nr:glycosyltransferase family 2 protein [Sphingomonas ginkgonis]RST30361.1 glycosyltransferase [Sphingomonas ginkgonis]
MLKIPTVSPEITVVIPCRNEELNVEKIAAAVIGQMETVCADFDVLFIENESSDGTIEAIRRACARDPRVKAIINTRNFGQLRSPTHGIFQAKGRAIIGMCADFQDPPELLPEMVRRWRAGTDIVLGVREFEKSSPLHAAMRDMSYSLQRRFGDYPIIPHATGFGLYSRRVVDSIRELNEPEPFFRGLLVETGYKIETIEFHRPPRAAGESNNGFFALLDFALHGLASSSKGLLRAPLYVTFFIGMACVFTLLGALYSMIVGANPRMWLFATLVEGQFGLLFLFLGLLGVHVRLISDRTRGTPLVLERERINFAPED